MVSYALLANSLREQSRMIAEASAMEELDDLGLVGMVECTAKDDGSISCLVRGYALDIDKNAIKDSFAITTTLEPSIPLSRIEDRVKRVVLDSWNAITTGQIQM